MLKSMSVHVFKFFLVENALNHILNVLETTTALLRNKLLNMSLVISI